jgi:hypothetical protein
MPLQMDPEQPSPSQAAQFKVSARTAVLHPTHLLVSHYVRLTAFSFLILIGRFATLEG